MEVYSPWLGSLVWRLHLSLVVHPAGVVHRRPLHPPHPRHGSPRHQQRRREDPHRQDQECSQSQDGRGPGVNICPKLWNSALST